MAKKTQLKERGTNEDLYPITSKECIVDFPEEFLDWELQWAEY